MNIKFSNQTFLIHFHPVSVSPICRRYLHVVIIVSADILAPQGRFKNTYELVKLGALKSSLLNKLHIFQCMGEIFCVEFQRVPLKFHTRYLTHTLKDTILTLCWKFKRSQIYELVCLFETPPLIMLLAPNSARPSTGTELTTKLDAFPGF